MSSFKPSPIPSLREGQAHAEARTFQEAAPELSLVQLALNIFFFLLFHLVLVDGFCVVCGGYVCVGVRQDLFHPQRLDKPPPPRSLTLGSFLQVTRL